MPVVSTCHITDATRKLLDELHGAPPDEKPFCWVADYSEGWFVRFWDDDGPEDLHELPSDLRAIRDWLLAAGHLDRWVRIDADGDCVSTLPVYDWT
uniref:DUF5983 family protein n=1 Tax=Cupriavidus gilardii TaxID=82541 RepID=UPI002479388C|nr:hypothetical protein [Cupriavidus gilardii]